MKTKFLPIIFAIIFSTNLFAANPQMVTTKKGVIREIAFPLSTLTADELAVGVTAATCRISKDGGALANTTNSFSAIGEGFYKITLTAIETDAAYISIICTHATEFYDKTILVNTYGEAGAFHVPEVVEADIISVNAVAVTNVNDFKATGFSTFNSASDTVTVGTNNDKTGYSLTQSFPTNFASLGINASGHILRTVLNDTTTTNTDMRGTNSAMLASSYIAPDNAGITSIKTVSDKLDTAMVLDGSVWQFTINALENSPAGGGGGGLTEIQVRDAVWQANLATYTLGQAGHVIQENLQTTLTCEVASNVD